MTIFPLGAPLPIGSTVIPDAISALQLAIAAVGTSNEVIRQQAAADLVAAAIAVISLLVPQTTEEA